MYNWVAQAFGFAGMLFAIISFQKKQRQGILFFQVLASFAYFFHFFMLGAFTGSVLNIIGAARNYVFYHKEKDWASHKLWFIFFMVIIVASTLCTWKNNYSILPMIGMIAQTASFWMKNPRHIRLLVLISPPCWFSYNLISGSLPGMLTEVFGLASVMIGIIRFDILKSAPNKE